MLAHQPHRPGLGVLVVPARHRAILPSKKGVHETRDGSLQLFADRLDLLHGAASEKCAQSVPTRLRVVR
jgi:hypothetical protein